MKHKDSITFFLLLFVAFALGFMLGRETQPRSAAGQTQNVPKKVETRYVVYYFFNGKRCVTCRNIENYTQQVVVEDFARALAEQRITFFPVNVDEERNKHFIDEFKLTNKSVVLTEYKKGKCVKFKILQKVWELANTKNLFEQYVHDEITAFSRLKK